MMLKKVTIETKGLPQIWSNPFSFFALTPSRFENLSKALKYTPISFIEVIYRIPKNGNLLKYFASRKNTSQKQIKYLQSLDKTAKMWYTDKKDDRGASEQEYLPRISLRRRCDNERVWCRRAAWRNTALATRITSVLLSQICGVLSVLRRFSVGEKRCCSGGMFLCFFIANRYNNRR